MPYVDQKIRDQYDPLIHELSQKLCTMPIGNINYVITRLIELRWRNEENSYFTINEIMGVLECVKQEFYRRAAGPYEDKKIEENGDVYHKDMAQEYKCTCGCQFFYCINEKYVCSNCYKEYRNINHTLIYTGLRLKNK